MILVCESGATKADWRAVESSAKGGVPVQVGRELTSGMNVSTMERGRIEKIILEAAGKLPPGPYERVHFYTAGVLTEDILSWLLPLLREAFGTAEAEANTDLVAAARAACGHAPGIAVIMGTGSNSCQFDGNKIVKQVKSGGFILGDEGSASAIGKLFISDYIKGLVPEEISKEFDEKFPGMDYPAVVTNVYHPVGSPSGWLGGFCPFIMSHYSHPYVKDLVDGSLQALVDRSLRQYDIDKYPVGIIGGFALALKDILEPLLQRNGIKVRAFIPSPIEELIKYHLD